MRYVLKTVGAIGPVGEQRYVMRSAHLQRLPVREVREWQLTSKGKYAERFADVETANAVGVRMRAAGHRCAAIPETEVEQVLPNVVMTDASTGQPRVGRVYY